MNQEKKRALLLACSRSKNPSSGLLPAIERYDGPLFRVLRKFLTEHPDEARSLHVYVLSAKFGLVPGGSMIPDYDLQMTEEKANSLNSKVLITFREIVKESNYQCLFLVMGKTYLAALNGFKELLDGGPEVKISSGSYGRLQADLYDWLHRHPPQPFSSLSAEGRASIGSVEVAYSPGEVLEIGLEALAQGVGEPARYQAWYVEVGSQRVSTKWLVSQLTGLAVSEFNTGQARRFLSRLGIEVKRA